jgi:type VI secretion system protein ImpL
VVTKLDLLAGFTEFFDDVGQPERDQVWGHTFDIDVSRTGSAAGEPFAAAFDALLERLNGRLLNRIQGERDMQRRGLIFGFPQQFANLFGPLSTLVQIIGRETKFEPTPLIRGVYFTSATQFGRPIDRVMAAVSAKFGVPAAAAAGQAAQGRSYFLRDLLQAVVFGEAALASRDPKTERRRRLVRIAAIAGGTAVLLLVSIGWTIGYLRGASMIHLLEQKAAHLQTLVAGLPAGQVSDSDLMAVLPALEEARTLPFATTAPEPLDRVRWTFGLSRTHALRSQVDAAYLNLLNHQMLPRLILDLEDQLRTASRGAGGDARQQTYGLLRIYLMLGRAPRAPLEKGQIVNWFANEWANRYAGAEDDGARAALQRHLETLLSGRLEPPSLDRDIIVAAREQVKSLSPGERAYARMLSDPALGDLPPFSLTDVADVAESGLFSRKSGKSLAVGVPGIYRKSAFYWSVVPAIAKVAAQSVNESWVTDDKAVTGALPEAEEVGRIKDQILIAYLKDFTRQWDDFINDITISSQHSARERIAIAVRPPSPVKLLLSTLAAETNLTPPSLNLRSQGGAMGALRVGAMFSRSMYRGVSRATQVQSAYSYGQGAQGPPGPLDEVVAHFKWLSDLNPPQGPAPLDTALQALAAVGDASISAQAASSLGDPLLQRSKTSTAMEATAHLDQTADALPPVVRAMFTGFVKTTASSLNQSVKQSLQQQYGAQLAGECKAIVAGGYPFSDSTHEVSIDDVSRLFRPSGLIDQFVQTNLAGMIDTSRRPWTVSAAGKAVGVQEASVQAFQRADEIKRRLFQPGDVRPNVRFLLEPLEVTSKTGAVTLSIDGQPAAFEKTNRKPVEMKWPGPTPSVSLSFPRDKGGPALRTWSGDFALARMLQSGKITASSAKSLSFEVGVDSDAASFTLRFLNGDNPFVFNEFKAFRCPAGL